MKKIRIGKDIAINWTILTNGEATALYSRDLKLELISPAGTKILLPFSSENNTIKTTFSGIQQKQLGIYKLTLWENFGKQGQTAVDHCDAFQLVPTTCQEGGTDNDLNTETVQLEGDSIEVGIGSGAGNGISLTDMWNALQGETNEQISVTHLTTALQGYATEQWIEQQGFLTEIPSAYITEEKLQSYNYATKEELPNVDSFITNTVDNLVNYYKKTETYTQSEINNLIGQITTINFEVVETLPDVGENNLIYLVKRLTRATTDDIYDEYIWIESEQKYESIGSTKVDLSNYYNKSEVDSRFALQVDIADMLTKTEASYTYATKAELGQINNILDSINGEVI